IAQIFWRSNVQKRPRLRVGGNALVLLDNDSNIIGIDIHGPDGSEINDAIPPLLDPLREGQETDPGLEEIIYGHIAMAIVDDTHAILAAFDVNRHKSTLDAAGAPPITKQLAANSGSVRGDDAEVGDVVALFKGGDGVDVEDDGGDGSAGLGDELARVVGDGAELHSSRDVGAALDEGIPDAGTVGEDVN